MDDYLTKPIEQEALGLMIERWAKPNATTNVMNTTSKVENTPQPSVFTMDGTPLDLERLDRISRGKVAVQQRLLQLFIENTQPGLEKMRLALQGQDFATVEQQAHRIKGSSANVGVLLMPDVAAQLERQARDKTLEGATERVEALEKQLEQVKAFLKAGLTQRS
jgi:HPt (histidine-containing phosphotransfer) domain-containing protein